MIDPTLFADDLSDDELEKFLSKGKSTNIKSKDTQSLMPTSPIPPKSNGEYKSITKNACSDGFNFTIKIETEGM